MIKKKNGITLISLIITIGLMLIISSTVVYISLDRFQINEFNKMVNDIGLLEDKVSNYYLRYGGLPVLRDRSSNEPLQLDETKITFTRNPIDNSVYYILDLEALDGISLNYGEDGFEAWKDYVENGSEDIPYNLEDVYVINENTHTIYYVEGISLKEKSYYYIKPGGTLTDNIPPSRPQINIISGERNDEGVYITAVEVEIVPGEDSWSGVGGTSYTVENESSEEEINHNEDSRVLFTISENGLYNIEARTYDNASTPNYSEITTITLETHITHIWDSGETTKAATCTEEGKIEYACTYNGCTATKTETVSALEHRYTKQDTSSQYLKTGATCTSTAVYYYSCVDCGAKGTSTFEYGSVLGHDFDEGTVTTAATCTTTGVKTYTCTNCGATKTETVSTLEHTYTKQDTSSQYLKTAATCTSASVYYYSCVNCGAKGTSTFEYGSMLGHSYNITIKAEKRIYTCSKCGDTYNKIAKEGEIVKYDSNKDGTLEDWVVLTSEEGKLEIVSSNVMYDKNGNGLTLGHTDPTITEPEDLDGDGITGEYNEVAVTSYNNAITTINNFCKNIITASDNEGVRSIGESTDTAGEHSSVGYNGVFKRFTNITLKASSDESIYKVDVNKLTELGILNVGVNYWVSARNILETGYETFEENGTYSNLDCDTYLRIGTNYGWSGYLYSHNIRYSGGTYHASGWNSITLGVRPVVINPTGIQYVEE